MELLIPFSVHNFEVQKCQLRNCWGCCKWNACRYIKELINNVSVYICRIKISIKWSMLQCYLINIT